MYSKQLRGGLFAIVSCLSLTGCLEELRGDNSSGASGISGGMATTAQNLAPVISGAPQTEVEVGTNYVFTPAAADANGDSLSFSASGLPAWAQIDARTGTVAGVPSDSDVGESAAISIAVTDGQQFTKLEAYTLKVRGKPGRSTPPSAIAPTISGTPATSVVANSTYTFTPAAVDPDSTSLAFSIANKPSWAAFNAKNGSITGTPAVADVRSYSNIVITVSDGTNSASLAAFSITVVAPANSAPSITGTAPTSVMVGTAYSFTPAANDPDGQALQYSIANKPSWATFNTSTGQLSGTPGTQNVGTTSGVTISVSDGVLSASLAPFAVTVSAPANSAPSISGTPITTATVGMAYGFTPSASDPDGNTLAFSISGKPAWASFSTATGALTGTPSSADVGSSVAIVISVSDGSSTRSLAPFTITITSSVALGDVELTWTVPTENTDGTPLIDLAGYRIYHGTDEAALSAVVDVPGAATSRYLLTGLPVGTRYFSITSYNSAGIESNRSVTASTLVN